MSLDDKLREIIFECFDVGFEHGITTWPEGEGKSLRENEKIAQIKQAFAAEGYVKVEYVPGSKYEFPMTGQEWYDRFRHELGMSAATRTEVVLKAAKRASGVTNENNAADKTPPQSLLEQAIDMSGNEFAMGYDDSADEWHFHSGIRGNGRMLLGTTFTSDNPDVTEALKEYIAFRKGDIH